MSDRKRSSRRWRAALLAAFGVLGGGCSTSPGAAAGRGRGYAAARSTRWPTQAGDYVTHDFRFKDGESLPALKLHYTTLGQPRRDARGRIVNAVMVLHGTGGSGAQFLRPQFADVLYRPGSLLDIARWYVILPDGIGHAPRPSRATGCMRASRTMTTPTWWPLNTCC